MSKPHWAYQPLADGGISVANQEATARATEQERTDDVVYARDYAAIVEALRRDRLRESHFTNEQFAIATLKQADSYRDDPTFNDWAFFASEWGVPALLKAIARAIELETK